MAHRGPLGQFDSQIALAGFLGKLRQRLLAGLAFYPMLVLLLIVLVSIHMSHWLGWSTWTACLLLGWTLFAWARLYDPRPPNNAPAICLLSMSLIALTYGALHERALLKIRRELQQWNQAAGLSESGNRSLSKAPSKRPSGTAAHRSQTHRYPKTIRSTIGRHSRTFRSPRSNGSNPGPISR